MRILFVDDRLEEVFRQWELSGCDNIHELLPLEPFESIERTQELVKTLQPDVIVIGYGLGKPLITGVDVIRSIRASGYSGAVIANSGGGGIQFTDVQTQGSADRHPSHLAEVLGKQRGETL